MRIALLALLPAIAAFRLPSPEVAFELAHDLVDDVLGGPAAAHAPADAVLSPASDITLASIPGDEHYVLTSALHPNHKVRIKSTQGWCDPDVRSYSGYLDVGHGKELFFYFFESRSDPANDPVIMWINGGPGCSSSMGLLMELGPCSVKDDFKTVNDTKVNPHSWNNKANIFFLDEPVNVGFSQAKHGQVVATAEEAGQDVAAFISIFFDTFKEFKGREFHMAGESYGGRYLPIFASAVYDQNKELVKAGKEPVNLQSVLIGNGITDWYATTLSYFPYQCTINGNMTDTVQSISACVEMAEAVPKCAKMAQEGCIDTRDPVSCEIAQMYCGATLSSSFIRANKNPYDVTKSCTLEELSDSLCYPETKKIKYYLDLPDVRARLGVDKAKGPFESCDSGVGYAFSAAQDNVGQTWLYVSELLERGIRILNYAGTHDFICNHLAQEPWMAALEWYGKEGYNAAKFEDWKVDGVLAGSYKTYDNLTLLKVYGAGHMVPFDQPKHSSIFLDDWLKAGRK
ncbi:hypothetical protein Q8F55_006540 [Vanrija albida]|uniref:Carboxypeptidase n=1 Tax=Vanrija albida TaxID=181172 RepID=A0ABR3PXH1_9TREE